MAEEMFGKSVKQLKLDRTMAKSSFTKQANFLSRKASNMTEMELREEFKKLTSDARHLQKFFPDVGLEDLKRPDTIELLISHREGRLAPQRVKVVGDLVLWNSPLGMTVGGAHPDLCEDVDVAAYRFRRGLHAALGDIKKMYNSVWLEDLERHLHRFLWRDGSEEEIGFQPAWVSCIGKYSDLKKKKGKREINEKMTLRRVGPGFL
ncbi:uncharacterized protein ACNS7B_023957 isoform 1-T1 [Menidia menidia]